MNAMDVSTLPMGTWVIIRNKDSVLEGKKCRLVKKQGRNVWLECPDYRRPNTLDGLWKTCARIGEVLSPAVELELELLALGKV